MQDRDVLAETEKPDLEVKPVSGAKIDELLAELYRTRPEVVETAVAAIRK